MRALRSWCARLGLDVDPIEEIIEHAVVDLDDGPDVPGVDGPTEDATVEALVEEAQAGAIEEEDLEGLLALAEEHEERPAARVASELLASDAGESIEAPAEIDGLEGEEDVDAVRDHVRLVRR